MENKQPQKPIKISGVCPISKDSINKNVARVNAFITFLIALLFIFTPYKWIIFLLGIDFFIRSFFDPSCSPVSIANGIILRTLKIKPKMINAGPKIFAAKTGFMFCLIISILYLSNLIFLAIIFSGILAFFAALETFFGYCVGCKIYSLLHSLRIR